jgi:ketosteroid isomerase-like protein
MSEHNKQIVLKFIEAMGACEVDAAASCLAPDASTSAKGFSKFAGVRTYETIIGTMKMLKKILPTGLRPAVHTVTAEGDRVVVEFEGNGITCEGKAYCNQYCMVFSLRSGKIKQVNEYFCTKLADEVLYPAVAALEQQGQDC